MGEAVIDLVEDSDGRFTPHLGGAPANVAIAASRLGAHAAFAGRLSQSSFGTRLHRWLAAEGVDLSLAERAPENQTVAVVSLDTTGTATYTFYTDGSADTTWPADPTVRIMRSEPAAFHFGSLAATVFPAAETVANVARAADANGYTVTSFDLNIRPALAGAPGRERSRVEALLAVAQIVKASDDDVRYLYPTERADEVARRWAESGAAVMLTRGGTGAAVFLPNGTRLAVPARKVTVADTIGAGDAFCGALLTRLAELGALGGGRERLLTLDLTGWREALWFAVTVASMSCQRFGAEPPRRATVDLVLSKEEAV